MPTVKEILMKHLLEADAQVKAGDTLKLSYQKALTDDLRITITHKIEVNSDFDYPIDDEFEVDEE